MHLFAFCKYPSVLPLGAGKAGKPKHCTKNKASHRRVMAVKVMKITAVILLATCLQAAAAGYGQKITLSEKEAPVEKIFTQIRKQTGYQFLYANQILAQAKKVTIQVKNADLEEVLLACFKGQPFDYHIKDKTIIVRMKEERKTSAADNQQPPIDVKGRVVNTKGEPISGATVSVQGTRKNTITNANGEFTLAGINENAILEISHVQYEGESIVLSGKSLVNAILQIKVSSLDETQVIAYGTTTKRFNTGNVTTVKAADIEKQPVNNPLLALQGRVAGLTVVQNTGVAGGGVTVRVQGQNSLGMGNDPLFVIDGVPYISQTLPTTFSGPLGNSGSLIINGVQQYGSGNPLSFINPADIESIEVLKDADATAIYGSRAANGALLITTKKGKSGKTSVTLNMYKGWGEITRKLDLLNTEQYRAMRLEALKNDGIATPSATDYDLNGFWDTAQYTDWQKALIGGTAQLTHADASVSGGNANTQFVISSTYHKETSVFPGDFSDKKGALHFNINHTSVNQRFKALLSGNYMVDRNSLPATSGNDLTSLAVSLPPNAPSLLLPDGSLNWATTPAGTTTWLNGDHPLLYTLRNFTNRTKNLVGNAVFSYRIVPGLDLKTSLGYTDFTSNETVTTPLVSIKPEDRATTLRSAIYSINTITSWIIEPQINYNRHVNAMEIQGLVGTTIQQTNSNGQLLRGSGYNSDLVLEDMKSAATLTATNTISSLYKYNGLFGRLNLNYNNKYILNLTARRDGSSRFGPENRFHNFGAVGAAWIFTNENLFHSRLSFLNFGKIRGSFGTTGNDQIGNYQFLNLYEASSYAVPFQGIRGLRPTGLTNPYLQWEETRKLQFGLDLGFLSNRIQLTTNYVFNRSSNQLISYILPVSTGFSVIYKNLDATVQNTAWEIILNTVNVRTKNFTWSSNINLTIPKNKLIKFPGLETSDYRLFLVIGQPLNIVRTYRSLGVNSSTGAYQFDDGKGGVTSRPDTASLLTQNVLINPNQKFYGGFQNSVSYKGFQLDFLFQFVKQIGRNYLFSGGTIIPGSRLANQPVSVLERWQKIDDEAPIQRFNSNSSIFNEFNNQRSSDSGYSDASFIRLKNLSLSWQVPAKWCSKALLQNCRLYTQCQNLLNITNYEGMDPENQSTSSLPPLRIITVGVQLGL